MHGSRLRVINAYFSESYLSRVNSPILPPDQRLLVWRSPEFNMKYPDERVQALQIVMGLIRYLKSGRAANAYLRKHMQSQS